MNVSLRVTGYDKQTERLSVEHALPADAVAEARELAHVGADDDGWGAYLLEPPAAAAIGLRINRALNVKFYDWFLEPA